MKKGAIAVSMCVGMAPSAAFAVDWSLTTTQSETVELNSNQFLQPSQAGSVGSYSTLTGNAEALTPTSKFDFDADGTYKKYWGPGVDALPSEYLTWGLKAHYDIFEKTESNQTGTKQTGYDQTTGANQAGYDQPIGASQTGANEIGANQIGNQAKADQTKTDQTKRDREFVEAVWRQQSTALALLDEFDVTIPIHGFIDRLTATGGIDRSVSALDNLSLLATSTQTSYEPSGGGIPFTDTLARGVWQHKLSSIAALTASSEAELLSYGDTFNTRIQIYRNQVGTQANLSPILSFQGNFGAAYLITDGGISTATPTLPVTSTDLDWIGDAILTYKILKDTTFTLTASQTIGPSIVGSLFKTDVAKAILTYNINDRSTLSFSPGWRKMISTVSTDYVIASVAYSYNFTREWTGQLTYRYQHRFASSGTVTVDPITGTPTVSGLGPSDSNSIMFVVSHKYTVLPHGS